MYRVWQPLPLTRNKKNARVFYLRTGTNSSVETQMALACLLCCFPEIRLVSGTFDYRPIYYLQSLKTLSVVM
jgi:hypothetical protein